MKLKLSSVFLEMGIIVLVASGTGMLWNHKMLTGVWSGNLNGFATVSSASQGQDAVPAPAGLMQVRDLYEKGAAVLVDARDTLVFSRGHIEGAVVLPVGEFDSRIAALLAKVPLDSTIVVYCNGYGCHDSMTVGKKLMARGYRNVLVFEGGYPEWKDAGLPVEGENDEA